MQFKKLQTSLLLGIFINFIHLDYSLAKEEAPAPKESIELSGSQSQEWATIQGDLSNMRGKIIVEQRTLEEMLVAGKSGGGRLSTDQVRTIKEQHKKLTDMTNNYNELLSKFELRFPERGQQIGRRYFRIDNLSLEQIENRMTLEDRRNSLVKKIRTQYNKPESDDTSQRPFDPEKDKRPEVTDPIILVK